MTQDNGDAHPSPDHHPPSNRTAMPKDRTRRRAGRPAGPPVEETGTSEVTVKSAVVVQLAKTLPANAEAATAESAGLEPTAEVAANAPEHDAIDAPDTAETPAGSKPKRGVGRIVALAASAVLVLALMVGAGASVYLVHSNSERADRRTAYVQAARQAVLNLTTIRADSAKDDIDRILATASGKFKTEFDGRVDPFMEVVKQAKVASTGEVIEAALVRDDENSATVLIAAKQTLTNAASAEPQTRFYRFRITVTRTDSGLSASNVEFVA